MPPSREPARFPRALPALLRALRSTLVIGAVAVLFAALRVGRFHPRGLTALAIENWPLLPVIFTGVLIWDWWFRRTAHSRAAPAP